MTSLVVRKIDFKFDDSIPFQWLPSHPKFGSMCNAVSFLAIGFEKFIVSATTRAIPQISDAAMVDEARAFLRQEAQHASIHRRHVNCLIKQHPGLQKTLNATLASYDHLIETTSLAWQLAYIADVEATFTSLFKLLLDHENELFRPGDERVASLFLWHFCEEIEHRSSALVVYDAVVPRPWYRLSICGEVLSHVHEIYDEVLRGFEEHVPEQSRQSSFSEISRAGVRREELLSRLPMPASWRAKLGVQGRSLFGPASNREMIRFVLRVFLSQRPNYTPANEPLPAFADAWFRHYEAGVDVTKYYSATAKIGR